MSSSDQEAALNTLKDISQYLPVQTRSVIICTLYPLLEYCVCNMHVAHFECNALSHTHATCEYHECLYDMHAT